MAVPIACPPAAQAEIAVNAGPVRPQRIAICAGAALAMIIGIVSGETPAAAPDARWMSCWASSVPTPPTALPITQPARSGSHGGASPQPACSRASCAATSASCV